MFKQACSQKNTSDLIFRFYVAFEKNVNGACFMSCMSKKASIKSCEAFVSLILNGKALPIDPDRLYLIREDSIRLVMLAQVVGYKKQRYLKA